MTTITTGIQTRQLAGSYLLHERVATGAIFEEKAPIGYALTDGTAFDESDPCITQEGEHFRRVGTYLGRHTLCSPEPQDCPSYELMRQLIWDETDDILLIGNAGHFNIGYLILHS